MSRAFSTVFQPIVEIETSRTIGFEALYRGPKESPWENPHMVFNVEGAVAEEDRFVMDVNCFESALVQGKGLLSNHDIFINVTAQTLKKLIDLEGYLMVYLEHFEIHPDRIVLELSECTRPELMSVITDGICKLRRHGIRIALDDAGTNHAGLSYMFRLDPDFMKVDQAFINGISCNERKRFIVEGLTDISRKMGIHIIGEGIESDLDCEVLKEMGVPYAQGFLFGRPLPVGRWQDDLDSKSSANVTGSTNRRECS